MILFQETDLVDYDVKKPFTIPDYETFIGPGKKIRVMTLVKKNTFHSAEPFKVTEEGQQLWIKLETPCGKKLHVCNVYREWNGNQQGDLTSLIRNMEHITGSNVIVLGDWNLDLWKDETYYEYKKAEELKMNLFQLNYQVVSPGPTWSRRRGEDTVTSCLDWAAHKGTFDLSIEKIDAGYSDHDMAKVTLNIEREKAKKRLIRKRDIGKICPADFGNSLGAKERWEGFDELCIHEKAKKLRSNVLDVLNIFAPIRAVPAKKKARPKPSPTLTRLRKSRDNAKNEKQFSKYKKLRNQCNALTRKETLEANGRRIENNPTEVWDLVDELCGKEKDSKIQLKEGGKYVAEEEIPSLFLEFFVEKINRLHQSLRPVGDDLFSNAKEISKVRKLKPGGFSFHEISFRRVREAIRKLKKTDSKDADGLTVRVLELCGEAIIAPLTKIINQSVREGIFPTEWKLSRVVPLHKKNSKTNLKNFRPICLVKVPSKIMEEIMRAQLSEYMENKSVIPSEQHGYREAHSVSTAVNRVSHLWRSCHERRDLVAALFFDLSSAFDLVDVEILTRKLEIYGLDKNSISLVRSYLNGRTWVVEVGDHLSEERCVPIGVPQGSGLSPLLFLVLISDLPLATSSDLVMFADDIIAVVSAKT